MNNSEIFELGLTLAHALNGEPKAIADLKVLFVRHPEMFENLEDLRNTIKEVALSPEIIMQNNKPKGNDIEIIAAKRLDDKKMGDIGIRNTGAANVVFHANKTRLNNFERLEKKARQQNTTTDGRDAHTPYTQAQSLDGRLVQKNISSVADSRIITQPLSKEKALSALNDIAAEFYTGAEYQSCIALNQQRVEEIYSAGKSITMQNIHQARNHHKERQQQIRNPPEQSKDKGGRER